MYLEEKKSTSWFLFYSHWGHVISSSEITIKSIHYVPLKAASGERSKNERKWKLTDFITFGVSPKDLKLIRSVGQCIKAGKPLYNSRAFIQTSEELQFPGLFHEPSIFVTTKYFFLWLCQVYYQRQGGTLLWFPLEFCRETSVSPERHSSDTLVWKPVLSKRQTAPSIIPNQPPGVSWGPDVSLSSIQKGSSPSCKPQWVCHSCSSTETLREGSVVQRSCLAGEWASPYHQLQSGAQILRLALPSSMLGPWQVPGLPRPSLYSFLGILLQLGASLWALVSPPVFPCNAVLCFIFKPDHHFLFSLCCNTQAPESQMQGRLCATALTYPKPNLTASVVPHARERQVPDRPSLPSPLCQVSAYCKHSISQWVPLAVMTQSCVICSCRQGLPCLPLVACNSTSSMKVLSQQNGVWAHRVD